MAAQARARGAEIDDEAPGAAGDILFGYRGERPAGRAELLANSAIRARIFAGSIQGGANIALMEVVCLRKYLGRSEGQKRRVHHLQPCAAEELQPVFRLARCRCTPACCGRVVITPEMIAVK